jgi:hypothetical protein
VVWSAPDGDPNSDVNDVFKTRWKCKGDDREVSASYCNTIVKYVDVTVPVDCNEGPERVRFDFDISLGCPDCSGTKGGCWGPIGYQNRAWVWARYHNCQRVWDVHAIGYTAYGVCFDNFNNVCDINDIDPNDRTEEIVGGIIGILVDPNDNGYNPAANCWECSLAHERTHQDAYEAYLDGAEDSLPDDPSMDPIDIDCEDDDTVHCRDVESAYADQLRDAINEIFAEAWNAAYDAEDAADDVAQACSENVACELCDYADGQGWSIDACDCCF